MRENIGLYRGKRIDNGEWVEGYLVTAAIAGKRLCLILVPCEGEIRLDGRLLRLALDAIENGRKIAGISDINGNSYFVDPETVGEYTGLTDKNGKMIFEGDIVKGLLLFGLPVLGVASFKDGAFGLAWQRGDVDEFSAFTSMCNVEYEVIGNIHDNPELLGGDSL